MKIGVCGGGDMWALGEGEEYKQLFKKLINYHLLDRLYKRYIRIGDLKQTKEILLGVASSLRNKNELELFAKLLKSVAFAIENTEYVLKKRGKYSPVHITLTDVPYCFLNIPLEDYDNLEGDPLWLRPEYMLEKYG
jgi:hypothetical protein